MDKLVQMSASQRRKANNDGGHKPLEMVLVAGSRHVFSLLRWAFLDYNQGQNKNESTNSKSPCLSAILHLNVERPAINWLDGGPIV